MAIEESTYENASASRIVAQSAFAQFPAAAGLDLSCELIVTAMPEIYLTEYQGTRAALEAEGVIPAGAQWPDGFDDLRWEDDLFRYRVRRQRPEGVKGSRKSLLNIDWWMFRCDPRKHISPEMLSIERKAKELADARFRASPDGAAAMNRQWDAWLKARMDEKYQAFKAGIPGISCTRRGRGSRINEQSSS